MFLEESIDEEEPMMSPSSYMDPGFVSGMSNDDFLESVLNNDNHPTTTSS